MTGFATKQTSNNTSTRTSLKVYRNRIPEIKSLSPFSINDSTIQRKPNCPCGGGCPRCRDHLTIQTKLKINEPGDKYEQEADRIADQVMRMTDDEVLSLSHTDTNIQRKCTSCASGGELCSECAQEEIQRKPISEAITPLLQRQNEEIEEEEEEILQTKKVPDGSIETTGNLGNKISGMRGPGQPLDRATRDFFEPRFSYDFSNVRLYTDTKASESAQLVNALAYTVGENIVFGAREYAPRTSAGKSLLAHELTHVVQQNYNKNAVIQRRVVDDDAHVPCRSTRVDAVETLRIAEEDAIKLAQRAAVTIYVHRTFHPLAQIAGESPGLRAFRDVLWRRFHFDFNRAQVRDTLLPIWERRFELVADWIRRLNHRYICGAPGGEPPGECTTRPGEGFAWTATGENRTELCDDFWGRSAEDLAGSILHEWFHFGFDWLGDCEQRHNRNNNKCYDMFARELGGTASPSDYESCCPPPADPLPPLAGVP